MLIVIVIVIENEDDDYDSSVSHQSLPLCIPDMVLISLMFLSEHRGSDRV